LRQADGKGLSPPLETQRLTAQTQSAPEPRSCEQNQTSLLLLDLNELGQPGLSAKLIGVTTLCGYGLGKLADLIIAAVDPGEDLLRTVAAFLNRRRPADTLGVALALIREDRRPVAGQLLAGCAEVLAPAFDESICASYTKLTARSRSIRTRRQGTQQRKIEVAVKPAVCGAENAPAGSANLTRVLLNNIHAGAIRSFFAPQSEFTARKTDNSSAFRSNKLPRLIGRIGCHSQLNAVVKCDS
jgi:hypothetical protein